MDICHLKEKKSYHCRKIVSDELEFDEEEWEVRNKRVRDLIVSCLKKEPEERITIDEFLNYPWFKKIKTKKFNVIFYFYIFYFYIN